MLFSDQSGLNNPPSDRQAPGASAAENDDVPELDYQFAGGSDDEAMGETLTVAEIKRSMQRQNLRGQHSCDGRTPARSESADDDGCEDPITMVLVVLGGGPKQLP